VERSRIKRPRPYPRVWGNSPIIWLLPLAVILILVFLYPILEIIRLSFTNASLLEEDYSFTLNSYLSLFRSPDFVAMLRVTAIFVFLSVIFQIVLGFIIALVVDQGVQRGLRGTVVTRTAVLAAWAIPGVIIGIIWGILYQESAGGVLNYVSESTIGESVPFLSDPVAALISVTVANIWRGTALSMILIYAGLQALPKDVLDAAKVDGTTAWQRLFKVIIPLLAPVLLITLIIVTIDTFNTFDMVLALTGGGPGRSTEVIALNVYTQIFEQFNLGQGAGTAVLLMMVNLVMTLVYVRFIEQSQGIE
jgi:multiple sugar transport system permease protein